MDPSFATSVVEARTGGAGTFRVAVHMLLFVHTVDMSLADTPLVVGTAAPAFLLDVDKVLADRPFDDKNLDGRLFFGTSPVGSLVFHPAGYMSLASRHDAALAVRLDADIHPYDLLFASRSLANRCVVVVGKRVGKKRSTRLRFP